MLNLLFKPKRHVWPYPLDGIGRRDDKDDIDDDGICAGLGVRSMTSLYSCSEGIDLSSGDSSPELRSVHEIDLL